MVEDENEDDFFAGLSKDQIEAYISEAEWRRAEEKLREDRETAVVYSAWAQEYYEETGEFPIFEVRPGGLELVAYFGKEEGYLEEDYAAEFRVEDDEELYGFLHQIDAEEEIEGKVPQAEEVNPIELVEMYASQETDIPKMYPFRIGIPEGIKEEVKAAYDTDMGDRTFHEETEWNGTFIAPGLQDHYSVE